MLGFAVRILSIDTHQEQSAAWRALRTANFPPQATARFSDLTAFDYDTCMKEIRPALRSADRLKEVRLAKELGDRFRRQYAEAASLAAQGL